MVLSRAFWSLLWSLASRKCCDSHNVDLGNSIGNSGGKQGRGNQPPYRRYGPDTEIQYQPPRTCKTHQNSLQKEAIRNFSVDPTSSTRTRLRTPLLRMPFPRHLVEVLCCGSKSGPPKVTVIPISGTSGTCDLSLLALNTKKALWCST